MSPSDGPGFRTRWYDEVASTNDIAFERGRAGEPEGLVIGARRQSRGRGRHGRTWFSPDGNLYASILLRPQAPLEKAASLSLTVALTLAEAIECLTEGRLSPRLKWPNDVLVDGAKLAGILLESGVVSGSASSRDQDAFIIVGIGVNLHHAPFDALYPVTTLVAQGVEVDPAELLEGILERLSPAIARWRREGFAAFRPAWLERAHGLGRKGAIRIGRDERLGSFVALDDDGALILEDASGGRFRTSAGELFFHVD